MPTEKQQQRDYVDPTLKERARAWGVKFELAYERRHAPHLESLAQQAAAELAERPAGFSERQLSDLLCVRTCNMLLDQLGVTTFGHLAAIPAERIRSINGLGQLSYHSIMAAISEAKANAEEFDDE